MGRLHIYAKVKKIRIHTENELETKFLHDKIIYATTHGDTWGFFIAKMLLGFVGKKKIYIESLSISK